MGFLSFLMGRTNQLVVWVGGLYSWDLLMKEGLLLRPTPNPLLGGRFKYFLCSSLTWWRFTFWRAYFSKGLKPPTRIPWVDTPLGKWGRIVHLEVASSQRPGDASRKGPSMWMPDRRGFGWPEYSIFMDSDKWWIHTAVDYTYINIFHHSRIFFYGYHEYDHHFFLIISIIILISCIYTYVHILITWASPVVIM